MAVIFRIFVKPSRIRIRHPRNTLYWLWELKTSFFMIFKIFAEFCWKCQKIGRKNQIFNIISPIQIDTESILKELHYMEEFHKIWFCKD